MSSFITILYFLLSSTMSFYSHVGNILFSWLLSQCNHCETKEEYDRYQHELTLFLQMPDTQAALSIYCINSFVKLQKSLKILKNKLAGYIRHFIKNCMDASTTSPVESNNNTVKHGPSNVLSNMNLDTATSGLLRGIINLLSRQRNEALRTLR